MFSRLFDERRCVPPYVILDFGNRGILGMQIPEEFGGLALRTGDFLRVMEQSIDRRARSSNGGSFHKFTEPGARVARQDARAYRASARQRVLRTC